MLRHVPTISVEEFIDGEEYTFDTITVDGEIAYYNIAWYRPRPLIARSNEWISPQVIALRDIEDADLAGGVQMGYDVIGASVKIWYRVYAHGVVPKSGRGGRVGEIGW